MKNLGIVGLWVVCAGGLVALFASLSKGPEPALSAQAHAMAPIPTADKLPIGAAVCAKPQYKKAESYINRALSALVDNAPYACMIVPEGDERRCSFMCMSEYSMTKGQQNQALVWTVGAAGHEINRIGPAHFGSILFADRTITETGYGYEIQASDAARIQKAALENRLSPQQLIDQIAAATTRHYTNRH